MWHEMHINICHSDCQSFQSPFLSLAIHCKLYHGLTSTLWPGGFSFPVLGFPPCPPGDLKSSFKTPLKWHSLLTSVAQEVRSSVSIYSPTYSTPVHMTHMVHRMSGENCFHLHVCFLWKDVSSLRIRTIPIQCGLSSASLSSGLAVFPSWWEDSL